ncbi:MAG: radical SAM protein [Planctomycetaceae bacterium]|nr:radical SAM protein [Planctomycetaceae bacterium]
MNSQDTIRIAHLVPCTEAEGPGRRFAIWVQGCPLRCPECCNPEMLPFNGGDETLVATLLQQIGDSRTLGVEGITLLGGEPFAHAGPLSLLAEQTQRLGLSVMAFSGYTLEELRAMNDPAVDALLRFTDLLVDGRYDRMQPDTSRRWIGSANQTIHLLTDRYDPNDQCWSQKNTLEIHWDGAELTVNGFPARSAISLWRRNISGAER